MDYTIGAFIIQLVGYSLPAVAAFVPGQEPKAAA